MCAREMPPTLAEIGRGKSAGMPLTQDLLVKHDYRDIKVGEDTTVTIDLEDLKETDGKGFYKALGCPFL